jgi:hypothetical protein
MSGGPVQAQPGRARGEGRWVKDCIVTLALCAAAVIHTPTCSSIRATGHCASHSVEDAWAHQKGVCVTYFRFPPSAVRFSPCFEEASSL